MLAWSFGVGRPRQAMANDRRRAAHISGWGRYAPSQVLTNEELSRMVDTSDEWIRQRTDILERRVADSRETTGSTSLRAAQAPLDVAGLDPRQVELIVVATLPSRDDCTVRTVMSSQQTTAPACRARQTGRSRATYHHAPG